MRCHYEVLDVARDAAPDDVKRAYKRAALRWHPDKNLGNEEEATERFKEVSQAFNVLSDARERQWYDDHRSAILRGGDGTNEQGSHAQGGEINLWKYFNTSCFSRFDDGEQGFFKVYSRVFMEIEQMEQENQEEADFPRTPFFGTSSSSWTEVHEFYTYWENYVSGMSFAWADTHNVLEAPTRAYRRAMEKENKKAREIVRREWQDLVKALVAYVKKRDPRVEAREEERKRQIEFETIRKQKEKKERKERFQAHRARWLEENHDEMEQELHQREEERKRSFLLAEEGTDVEEDEEQEEDNDDDAPAPEVSDDAGLAEQENVEVPEVFNCEICTKMFESEAQFAQHSNSRAHRKRVSEMEKKQKKCSKTRKAAPTTMGEDEGETVAPERELDESQVHPEEEPHAAVTEVRGKSGKARRRNGRESLEELLVDPDDNPVPLIVPLPEAQSDTTEPKESAGVHDCRVCGQKFISKTKLFGHIRDSGHAYALPLEVAKPAPAESEGRKSTKKKQKNKTAS